MERHVLHAIEQNNDEILTKFILDLAKRTAKKVFSALANFEVPFDLILDQLNVVRSRAHSPLFQVGVNYRMNDLLTIPFGDCQLEIAVFEDAKNPYDLSFSITQSANGTCMVDITCREDLYPPVVW
ncbi:hypothetical protein SLS56_000421 [Neofusicoccum ribis]|uniref:Uncharacterized protein n=1 Tax=Neofusicoccum ribis TaxID=45134 RepID=A0ABR3TE91_9PEZI